MSGGSYNYLSHTWDLGDIRGKLCDLRQMNERLGELAERDFPGASAAHAESLRLEVLLDRWDREATTRVNLLRPVWKAIEWWDSSDWSPEQVAEALAAFAEGPHVHTWIEVMANDQKDPVKWVCDSCPVTTTTKPV